MWSEELWIGERQRLYELMRANPEWSARAYARAVGHDPKWVNKWVKRFRSQEQVTLESLRSQSRCPKHKPDEVAERVKDRIGELREVLSERFNRAAGAKTIAYFLKTDLSVSTVQPSLSSIHRVLVERGYIRTRPKPVPRPLDLPTPNEEWELDFGEIYLGPVEGSLEFLLVVDRGTSRVVFIEGSDGYRAESAIDAVMRLFMQHGLPKRLRFDRDPRLWGTKAANYPGTPVVLAHGESDSPVSSLE